MKKIFIYLLLSFPAKYSFAQIKDGSKVLTSTISNFGIAFSKGEASSTTTPTLTTKTTSIGLRPELTYGKVKNNSLLSYGFNFSWGLITQSGGSDFHSMGVGLVISYEKFYPVIDRLYYSPFTRLNIGYQHSKQDATATSSAYIQNGFIGSIAFYPFSLTFSKSPKTNFLVMLGNVLLNYDRTRSFYKPTLNNAKTISNSFTMTASIGGISFGIQKLL